MATFTATAAQANQPAIYTINRSVTRVVQYTQSASLSIGDVIQMVKIPNGAVVTAVQYGFSLSAGVVGVKIGDGNDVSAYAADTLFSGSNTAAATMTFRGLGRSYSAEDTVDITIFSVSTAPANAIFTLMVSYTNQNGS